MWHFEWKRNSSLGLKKREKKKDSLNINTPVHPMRVGTSVFFPLQYPQDAGQCMARQAYGWVHVHTWTWCECERNKKFGNKLLQLRIQDVIKMPGECIEFSH